MNNERCETCKFWVLRLDHLGLCRRNAPVVVRPGEKDMLPRWPITASDDWCGEYKPKDK